MVSVRMSWVTDKARSSDCDKCAELRENDDHRRRNRRRKGRDDNAAKRFREIDGELRISFSRPVNGARLCCIDKYASPRRVSENLREGNDLVSVFSNLSACFSHGPFFSGMTISTSLSSAISLTTPSASTVTSPETFVP